MANAIPMQAFIDFGERHGIIIPSEFELKISKIDNSFHIVMYRIIEALTTDDGEEAYAERAEIVRHTANLARILLKRHLDNAKKSASSPQSSSNAIPMQAFIDFGKRHGIIIPTEFELKISAPNNSFHIVMYRIIEALTTNDGEEAYAERVEIVRHTANLTRILLKRHLDNAKKSASSPQSSLNADRQYVQQGESQATTQAAQQVATAQPVTQTAQQVATAQPVTQAAQQVATAQLATQATQQVATTQPATQATQQVSTSTPDDQVVGNMIQKRVHPEDQSTETPTPSTKQNVAPAKAPNVNATRKKYSLKPQYDMSLPREERISRDVVNANKRIEKRPHLDVNTPFEFNDEMCDFFIHAWVTLDKNTREHVVFLLENRIATITIVRGLMYAYARANDLFIARDDVNKTFEKAVIRLDKNFMSTLGGIIDNVNHGREEISHAHVTPIVLAFLKSEDEIINLTDEERESLEYLTSYFEERQERIRSRRATSDDSVRESTSLKSAISRTSSENGRTTPKKKVTFVEKPSAEDEHERSSLYA
jgi:hypothetical protein